jgi:hypothetical protein
MMKFKLMISAVVLGLGLFAATMSVPCWAETYYVTPAEAEAMLEKATAALKKNEAEALEAFSYDTAGFVDRELFIICFNTQTGKITAPKDPASTDTVDIRTTWSGLGQQFYDAATKLGEEGTAMINYELPMHEGGEPVSRYMYVFRVRNQGCGTMLYDWHTKSHFVPPQIQRIEIWDAGIYKIEKTGTGTNVIANQTLIQKTTTVPATLGTRFGIRFRVIGQPNGAIANFKLLIRFPAPGMKNPTTGETLMRWESIGSKKLGGESYGGYGFDSDWELVTGTWTFEIWQEDHKLAEQSFMVVKP